MSTALVALELAELQAFADLYASAGKDAAEACGISVATVGPATLFTANRIDVLALNRPDLGCNWIIAPARDASAPRSSFRRR